MANNFGQALDFEKPVLELEKQIEEIKQFSIDKKIDMSEQIRVLEEKAEMLRADVLKNLTPWQRIQIARHPKRPTFLDYIGMIFPDFMELHGDRSFRDDPAMVGGIASLEGIPVTVIGQQKGRDTKENIYRNFGLPHPEGYRKALRLMEQANKFRRPIICLVDVIGAYHGVQAEERGQGEAIARNIRDMANLTVPVIAVIIGEGGSGGALGIAVGNYVLMMENAIYTVISPEGCSAILWKDQDHVEAAAKALRITAQDLLSFGFIDDIIPEPAGGAQTDHDAAAGALDSKLYPALQSLLGKSGSELREQRYQKFRCMGAVESC